MTVYGYFPLSFRCPKHKVPLVFSERIIECLLDFQSNKRESEEEDRDKDFLGYMSRIMRSKFSSEEMGRFSAKDLPWPIAVNVEKENLAVLGWCPQCRKVVLGSIAISRLTRIIAQERKKLKKKE